MDTVSHKFYIILNIKYYYKHVIHDLSVTVDALTQTLLFKKKKKKEKKEKNLRDIIQITRLILD